MIFLYQLTHHYFDINVNSLFKFQSSSTRGHRFKIYKPHAKWVCRSQFFTVHSINNWNNLLANAMDLSSIDLFKNFIDSFWTCKQYEILWLIT